MLDMRGAKGVRRTYFKSKPCREGGLFFASLFYLQDMLPSSQNLQLELLISSNCAGKFYGCFRQDAMVIFIDIYPSTEYMFDIVIVIGKVFVIF